MNNNQLDNDKPDLTGIHDSATCALGVNGNRCPTCDWANEIEVRREREEWSVEVALDSFRRAYGLEALKTLVGQLLNAA